MPIILSLLWMDPFDYVPDPGPASCHEDDALALMLPDLYPYYPNSTQSMSRCIIHNTTWWHHDCSYIIVAEE